MILAKGAFRSTGRVRGAGGWAAGRCYADVSAAGAPARFCGADGLAVGSVAGWAIAVAELEFQCLQKISGGQGMSLNYSSMACQTSGRFDGRRESDSDCGTPAIDRNTLMVIVTQCFRFKCHPKKPLCRLRKPVGSVFAAATQCVANMETCFEHFSIANFSNSIRREKSFYFEPQNGSKSTNGTHKVHAGS